MDAALARAKALQTEIEALAVEQKRSAPVPAKGGLASAAKPASARTDAQGRFRSAGGELFSRRSAP